MKGLITRFTIGAVFALPLMLLSFALAQAKPPAQPVTSVKGNCQACHEGFQKAWEAGAHGRATVDPTFNTGETLTSITLAPRSGAVLLR